MFDKYIMRLHGIDLQSATLAVLLTSKEIQQATEGERIRTQINGVTAELAISINDKSKRVDIGWQTESQTKPTAQANAESDIPAGWEQQAIDLDQ